MKVLVVGGGDVAAHKVHLLDELGCELTVIAPEVIDSIKTSSAKWIQREYQRGDCGGFRLVVAATNRREVNRSVSDEAKSLYVPVNVVDDPQLCTVIFPAVWRQRPLTVAVCTEGVAPFMAAAVRDRLAGQAAQLAPWVELAGRFRAAVRAEIPDWDEKKLLYRKFIHSVKPDEVLAAPAGARLGDWLDWLGQAREDEGNGK